MGTLTAALESTKGVKKKETLPKTDKISMLHFSKLHRSKFQYSDKGKTPEEYQKEVIALSDELEADGKVLEPIIVRKAGVDAYEIIAGQHRRDASEYNVVVKGLTEFEFVPCIIVNMTDAQAEYSTFSSNKKWNQSDWHIMYEIERKKYLLENFPEEFPHIPDKGRMVDKLALELNLSKSTIGEYLQISKNLSDNAKESFAAGEINKSAAVSMASLPHEEQDKLIDAGITRQKDIKAYKEEKIEKTVHRTTVTDTMKTIKEHNIEENLTENVEAVPETVLDVLPGQYRVANIDMELEEVSSKDFDVMEGCCECSNCKLLSKKKNVYIFYGKKYCVNCLPALLQDLADTGVITLDKSAVDTKGTVIHS